MITLKLHVYNDFNEIATYFNKIAISGPRRVHKHKWGSEHLALGHQHIDDHTVRHYFFSKTNSPFISHDDVTTCKCFSHSMPLWWESTDLWCVFLSQSSVMRSFDVFVVVVPNMLLNNQSCCWWFKIWYSYDVTIMSNTCFCDQTTLINMSDEVSWLRHHMETLSTLLALCEGNLVTAGFPWQRNNRTEL